MVDESTGRSTNVSGEMRGTTRWMAPELMHPEAFGFTGDLLKQVPSKDTDIYAIGMTILEASACLHIYHRNIGLTPRQVLTGCRPFNESPRNMTVIFKVMKGDRPNRPPLGFSDGLWKMLKKTWVEQRVKGPRRRPAASAVLDRLKQDVDHWEKSIAPLVPRQWHESGRYNTPRTNFVVCLYPFTPSTATNSEVVGK